MHTVLLDLICLYSVMWPSLLKANYALHMSCLSKLYCYLSGELKVVERPQSVGLLPVQGWKMASKNLGFRFKKPKTSKVQNLSFLGFLIFGEILYRSYLFSCFFSFVSFVIPVTYRKRCDRESGVQDVLPGSEFCV